MTDKNHTAPHHSPRQQLPITYHPCLEESFDDWASACGWDARSLRQATERAIRTCHHEAAVDNRPYKTSANQPDVFNLSLGSVQVFYTVEPLGVMIRGYGWEIDREPLDDFDGGGYYAEVSWSCST